MSKKSDFSFVDLSKDNPRLTGFVYGGSGTGKTTLCASACEVPAMSPVLLIDCSSSSDTLRADTRFEDVTVVQLENFAGISGIYTWLMNEGMEQYQFKTIIIDEIDNLHWSALMHIMDGNLLADDKRERHQIYLSDYGAARAMLTNVINHFLKLKTHLFLTSLVRHKEDIVTHHEIKMPGIAGQLRDELPAKMGYYIYLDISIPTRREVKKGKDPNGVRTAYFVPTRTFKAKVRGAERANRLGNSMENPTMEKIFNLY